MKRPSHRSKLLPLCELPFVLALTLLLTPSAVTAQRARPEAGLAVDRMASAAGADVAATVSRATGLVTIVRTGRGTPIRLRASSTAVERAHAFVATYGEAFGLAPGVEAIPSRVSLPDETGMEHVRLRQTYRGIPVTGGELTLHLRGRSVVAVHAKTLPDLDRVETDPVVTAAEAVALAPGLPARGDGGDRGGLE